MEPLMAAVEHGPGQHGAAVNVILIVLVVSALIAVLVRVVRSRKRSVERSERDGDQGRGA